MRFLAHNIKAHGLEERVNVFGNSFDSSSLDGFPLSETIFYLDPEWRGRPLEVADFYPHQMYPDPTETMSGIGKLGGERFILKSPRNFSLGPSSLPHIELQVELYGECNVKYIFFGSSDFLQNVSSLNRKIKLD